MRHAAYLAALLIVIVVVASRYAIGSGWTKHGRNEPGRGERLIVVSILTVLLLLWLTDVVHTAIGLLAEDVAPMRVAFWASLICLVAAFGTYVGVYLWFRELWVGRQMTDVVSCLLSHVPNDDSPAWPHVVAGMTGSFGVCLLAGVYIAKVGTAIDTDRVSQESVALTAGGLTFAWLISGLSFWTLCQTKRIEQAQGARLTGFRDLVKAISADLRRVNDDFEKSAHRARSHHQFYLVTTNPYFGNLSYPNEDITAEFEKQLLRAAAFVKMSNAHEQFQCEVLCGSESAIVEFHRKFYSSENGERAPVDDANVVSKNAEAERLIGELNRRAGKTVVSRVNEIPPTQFAIIGNTVYDFILDTPGLESEIHQARRITERISRGRFVETFRLLKRVK